MTRRAVEASPQTYARIGGILYLFIIVAALFGEVFVRGRLIVQGDAAGTANNILGSETLFRVGLAGEMLTCVCDVALAMILYVLLKPVSRNLALLAAFLRVTFVGVYGVAKLFEIAALVVLGGRRLPESLRASVIGGLGYVVFSLAQMLAPAFAARFLFPWILLPAFPAELGLSLWLIVKGVDVPKWEERARNPVPAAVRPPAS